MTSHRHPTRRDFLALTAAGIAGLARPRRQGEYMQPDEALLYAGAYTEEDHRAGIAILRFDSRNGALRQVGTADAGPSPSFLAIHPSGETLYAVNEVTQRDGEASGGVSAFAIAGNTGVLTLLNEQASVGGAPCYASVDRDGRVVLVANYVGGSVAVLPVRRQGMLGQATHAVQHVGSGPKRDRQDAPHAHCIVTDPTNRFALVADLGTDRVLVYRLDTEAGTLAHVADGDGAVQPGAGPRHIAFHPRLPLVYVVNELDSTVTIFRWDAERGALAPVSSHSALPPKFSGTSWAADLHFDANGRFLYVSNRGHNSIAVFAVDRRSGSLKLEQHVSTGGDWPRNFTLDPTGGWLLVGNQRSGSIVVLRRDARSGRLSSTPHRIEVPRVACLRFG